MKNLTCTTLLIISCISLKAQQLFIPYGKINFEKKVNLQRSFAELDIPDEAKERIKKYNITNWELRFDRNRSIYKSIKKDAESNSNLVFGLSEGLGNELYADYAQKRRIFRRNIMGDDYIFADTIPKVTWKIMHEVRNIAGYECRKAIGRINDTIYVVAFYTDEILLRGGPEGFSGLPGMILGLAIPRYFTTWFATKVEAFNNPGNNIVPPEKGKKAENEKEQKKLIELYNRFDGPKKLKPEEIKQRIYGFTL